MIKENIGQKFEHLLKVLQEEKFLSMKALGGEIPFFISAYNPEQELEVAKAVKGLTNRLENSGITVLELNLYDISLQVLGEELGEGEVLDLERELDKDEFKTTLQAIIDINEVFMPRLKAMIDSSSAKVYFITGVGQVFPFLRSHNILNNLQNIAKAAPTLMFFPGKYNGQSLELFGLLKDDNYYRAFNIDKYKI